MLIFDLYKVGEKLFSFRKSKGFTQAEVAEKAGLSDRTYADIERGSVNMRVDTLLKICDALNITPDEILTKNADDIEIEKGNLMMIFDELPEQNKKIALKLLSVYLKSI